ncbi:uncharacterized protein B0H18DRAFT_990380 [Fomitopsis serialis]|uniref:uncharacterized protein n=1 Tax=Fomitopsis serialis TaxID=139415 RepID=UPI0020072C1D|nr:uncharacterized protein B0H18DRAFT_990380 [Neoantrodia serialis]KAH9931225.1 hypothetical protein B0H18DRAFT_990380 [Neoantrodia serialis]
MLTTMDRMIILQEKRFLGTVASRGMELLASGNTGMGSALRERYDRLDELVRRKMPHSHDEDFEHWHTSKNHSWREDSMQQQKNRREDAHPRAKGLRRNTY